MISPIIGRIDNDTDYILIIQEERYREGGMRSAPFPLSGMDKPYDAAADNDGMIIDLYDKIPFITYTHYASGCCCCAKERVCRRTPSTSIIFLAFSGRLCYVLLPSQALSSLRRWSNERTIRSAS